jgi:hypothetical protein
MWRRQQLDFAMTTPGRGFGFAAAAFGFPDAERLPTAAAQLSNHGKCKRRRRNTYLSVLYCSNFDNARTATREDALPWASLEFGCFASVGVRLAKE